MMAALARRSPVVVIAGVAIGIAGAGSAVAISGGGYTPHKQGCPHGSAANNKANEPQSPGCHDTQLMVRDAKGHTYVQTGTNTTRSGRNVHSADVLVSPDGSGRPTGRASGTAVRLHLNTHAQPIPPGQCGVFDLLTYPIELATGGGCKLDPTAWRLPKQAPTLGHKTKVGKDVVVVPSASGVQLYFGADDGLDSGEHDEPDARHGTSKEQNGASDGGAIVARVHPGHVAKWLPLVLAGASKQQFGKLASDPVPVADGGAGACADGICFSAQSRRQVAYRGGGGAGKHRDAYNYDGKSWDPYNCSGESVKAEKACHDSKHHNEDSYRHAEAKRVDLEPGFQFYEDPDPNGSPAAPMYPLPSLYAGTCGVTAGGGAMTMPSSPVTNHSGQVSVSPTGC